MSSGSAERRLAKLESSLTPTQAVWRWLDGAHATGSLDVFTAGVFSGPVTPTQLDGVIGSVEGGIREAMQGQPRDALERALTAAARQTAFRFLLAIRLNVTADEQARVRSLAGVALFFWMRALDGDEVTREVLGETDEAMAATWQRWHETALALLVSVYVEEEARLALEHDYLDGRCCLFPDVLASWTEARDMAERVARFALFFASLGQDEPMSSINEVTFESQRAEARERAGERSSYLADIVRAQTLVLAHDERRALEIMAARFAAS